MNTAAGKFDIIGLEHIATSAETPLREDAFDIDDEPKLNESRHTFRK